jgi:hypothetical protein
MRVEMNYRKDEIEYVISSEDVQRLRDLTAMLAGYTATERVKEDVEKWVKEMFVIVRTITKDEA